MPFLSGKDRDAVADRTRRKCNHCKEEVYKAYCSRCDEFYETGHKPTCPHANPTNIVGEEHGVGPGKCGGDRGYR
jgi:hypothetical protein